MDALPCSPHIRSLALSAVCKLTPDELDALRLTVNEKLMWPGLHAACGYAQEVRHRHLYSYQYRVRQAA